MRVLLLMLALAGCFSATAADETDDRSRSDAILRLLNSRASGCPKDYAAAAEIVAEDAARGKILQQYVLAIVSTDRNAPKAVQLTDEVRQRYLDGSRDKIKALAVQRSNALAWYLLSLEKGDATLLKRAAEGGNVQALNAWGTLTLTKTLRNLGDDTNDVERVFYKSYSCFNEAAGKGDMNGVYNLGMCYLNGYGVEVDLDRAFECFRTASEAGHPEAINNLGGFYRDGIVVEKDPVIATRWFAKSAEMGNAYGQLNYALALQRGDGLKADVVKAADYFKRSADQGCAEAVNAYAMCLYRGAGVPENKVLAVAWYRSAAESGFAPAMENLASCYERGEGGLEKSVKRATVWKIRARAARGDRNAAAWLNQNGY